MDLALRKGDFMDDATASLKKKLDQLLLEAAKVSVALDRADGTIEGVPHYSVIEGRAHELGKRLSREIQARQMAEITARADAAARCPGCGSRYETVRKKRRVKAVDGFLKVEEPVSHCPKCRRDFFPPPGKVGL